LKIESGTVVSFHYTLRNEEGKELESSRGSEPSVYLHGANNIIRGLEKANPDKIQRVPVKHLAYRGKLEAGKVVQLNTSEGMRAVTVVKAGRHSADIDANHPLAGQTLTFDVEIVDLRPATPEEISHGHAHGPGGHHH